MNPFSKTAAYVSSLGRSSRIILEWQLERDSNGSLVGAIFRGESEEDLQLLSGPVDFARTRFFADDFGTLIDNHKRYSYQLRCPAGNSSVFSWDGERDVVSEFVIGEHNFLFRYVTGVPVAIFQKMHEGIQRCTECWDPISKKPSKSQCTTCFGTGWVKGYYSPIYTWADMTSSVRALHQQPWGDDQPEQITIQLTDYPQVRPEDMLVELRNGQRWKVVTVQDSDKRRRGILQTLQLDKVTHTSIEYRLEVPEELILRASRELDELRSGPYAI